MSMNVLVLGGVKRVPTESDREYYSKYVEFFEHSAASVRIESTIKTALFDDLIISVGDGEFNIYDTANQCSLNSYNAIFFRGDGFRHQMDILATVNEFAKQNNIVTINDYRNVRDSSKLLQAVQFHVIGVPVARTLFVSKALIDNFALVVDWQFPCIMKASHGSHGRDNYLVHNLEEVMDILERDRKAYVLQRFVPNDGDFRVLVVGERVLVIGRTASGASHLNNTSQGGVAERVDMDRLPPQVIDHVKAICRHYGMTIAGVDVMLDRNSGSPYFLEVNAQPQLMTGAFVDEKRKLIGLLLQTLADQR